MSGGRTHVLAEADGHTLVAGVVHAHTKVSDGRLSPEELVAFAHRKGLGIVCITDHHSNEWRYRWGIRLSRPSVVSFGIPEYLEAMRYAANSGIGPIVLPGIEIVPFYRWERLPPFLRCQAMKNLVAYGVEKPSVIEDLPARLDGRGRNEAEALDSAQRVIEHLRSHGCLVYWSHLEEDERFGYLTAEMRYRPRPELLAQTSAYTGFGCFPQGYRESCSPGGLWDRQLGAGVEAGTRHGPWVIGEADYHSGDRDEQYRDICNPTTVFNLTSLETDDVFRALAQGRMYAYSGRRFPDSLLEVFRVTDAATGAVGRMGDTIPVVGEPILDVKVSGFVTSCRIRIICGGTIWREESARQLTTRLPLPLKSGYACRAEVVSDGVEQVMTNPVFVVPPGTPLGHIRKGADQHPS